MFDNVEDIDGVELRSTSAAVHRQHAGVNAALFLFVISHVACSGSGCIEFKGI